MSSTPVRRGSRTLAGVPASVLSELNAGGVSRNHIEQMALDMTKLLSNVLPQASHGSHQVASPRFLVRMRAAAAVAYEHLGNDLFTQATRWSSDTARGWAAFAVPMTRRTVEAQLKLSRPYAADRHFAVREWAWLGIRPTVGGDLSAAINELRDWAHHFDPNVRRFAVEVTRPRGVWSSHLPALKADPAPGLVLLDPVVTDTHPYVRDSVANWLNDARKSQPAWVDGQLTRWARAHGAEAMEYVTRRALRLPATTQRRGLPI